MKLFSRMRKTLFALKRECSDTRFPILTTPMHAYTGALMKSRDADQLQLVHAPSESGKYEGYIYSIPLGELLGKLHTELTKDLVGLFGKGFCLDGEIVSVTRKGNYYGCTLLIYDTSDFLKGEVLPMIVE